MDLPRPVFRVGAVVLLHHCPVTNVAFVLWVASCGLKWSLLTPRPSMYVLNDVCALSPKRRLREILQSLSRGVGVRVRDTMGNTVLHLACPNGAGEGGVSAGGGPHDRQRCRGDGAGLLESKPATLTVMR